MPILTFAHYNLRLPPHKIEDVCRFYTDVVGLQQGARPVLDNSGYWLYAQGKDVLHLTQAPFENATPTSGHPSFDHVAFHAQDLALHRQILQDQGIAYIEDYIAPIAKHRLYFKDPVGNGVELLFIADDKPAI